MADIVKILEGELDRIAEALPTLDPRTTEYTAAVCNLGEVYYRISNFKVYNGLTVHKDNAFAYKIDCVTDSVVLTPATVEALPTVEPTPEPVVDTPAPAKDMGDYRMSLRERMADARLKGVNITDLIKKVGADKFSAVPDDKLTELSDLLESAVKELE